MGISEWLTEIAERGYADVSGRYVCARCLTPEALDVLAPNLIEDEPCTFCSAAGPTVDFETFMTKFMYMIGRQYGDAHAQGVLVIDGEYFAKVWSGDEIADAHSDLALTNADAITFVREALDGDRVWAYRDGLEPPDEAMRFAWSRLSDTVKYRQRYIFLSEEDGGRPDELSPRQYLEKLDQIIHDNAMTLTLPKGSEIYRVRPYDATRDFPLVAAELGSAPADLAGPNRMSPAGISMFYGSENLDTAIAETTNGRTAPAVAVGRWRTVQDLHLVDLTKEIPRSNLFAAAHGADSDFETHFNGSYLRRFAEEIAAPIRPGIPHIEYVPTQVVTEYLRFARHGAYDGIRFNSAKNGQPNYVLFAHALQCADAGDAHLSTVVELAEAYDRLL
ncbi:RES family NAD+ phosphorylase [Prescottella equi]